MKKNKKAKRVINKQKIFSFISFIFLLICCLWYGGRAIYFYLDSRKTFENEDKLLAQTIIDKNYEVLSVSQFTLYGDTKKGNRPSYVNALNHEEAAKLYDIFNQKLKEKLHDKVSTGIFRSDMKVSLINDGPITIMIER